MGEARMCLQRDHSTNLASKGQVSCEYVINRVFDTFGVFPSKQYTHLLASRFVCVYHL